MWGREREEGIQNRKRVCLYGLNDYLTFADFGITLASLKMPTHAHTLEHTRENLAY